MNDAKVRFGHVGSADRFELETVGGWFVYGATGSPGWWWTLVSPDGEVYRTGARQQAEEDLVAWAVGKVRELGGDTELRGLTLEREA